MVVGEIPEPVDFLVIGGGPAGYVGAIRAAQWGRQVVLVERGGKAGLGGDCLHSACIPSKALIETADAAYRIEHGGIAGLVGSATVDLARWQAWRTDLVTGLERGVGDLLRAAGVTVLAGEARFTRPDQVVVSDAGGMPHYYQFADALIATGSRPAAPGGLPVDGTRVLDTAMMLAVTAIPARLAVVGGGCAGVELATAFAKLGSAVTVIEAADRLLPSLDPALSQPVARRLRELGVQVRTGMRAIGDDGAAVRIEPAGPSDARPSIAGSAGREPGADCAEIPTDLVLVAAGRRPNTDDLGLDLAGVAADPVDGRLPVGPDLRLATGTGTRSAGRAGDRRVGHLAAAGDITPGLSLAHTASAQALVAVAALSGQRVEYQPQAVPVTVFADPQVASAGLTVDQARAAGFNAAATRLPLAASGRAATLRTRLGFAQIVSDTDDGAVLGVQLAGPDACELIAAAEVAIEMGASTADLEHMVFAHPTLSEQFPEAARLSLGMPTQFPARTR